MKITKQPFRVRLIFTIGLLMAVLPTLFKEYIPIPDFIRGFMIGLGLTMEAGVLIFINVNPDKLNRCFDKPKPDNI